MHVAEHEQHIEGMAAYLKAAVLSDRIMHRTTDGRIVPMADHVADYLLGEMVTSQCVAVMRAVRRRDKDALFALMDQLTNDAIEQAAVDIVEGE